MAKRYELTIKASYLPGWDMYAGVRELIQNARDAEVQFGAKMTVEHVYRVRDKRPVGALVITNEGTTMPKETFLIGHTSKEGRSDLIGKFGEGLKFGCIALLRLGHTVKIRNGSESWNPLIVRSERYDAEVLAFDVADGNKNENRVCIEVLGIERDDWEKIQKKFLFLSPPEKNNIIEVYGGRILTSSEECGNVYVKGMFVCRDERLGFGYDVDEADIDRDRRMVSDRAAVTGRLLSAAAREGKLIGNMYEMLKLQKADVDDISYYSLGTETCNRFVSCFRAEYGADAVPAESEEQVTELGHLGIRGVKVPWTLRSVLESALGETSKRLRELRMNAKHVYAMNELTMDEQNVFHKASDLVRKAMVVVGLDEGVCDHLRVVDFGDDQLLGTHHAADNGVRLARKVLSTQAKTLRVLIHEVAHMNGRDGTKQHEAAIGDLTEAVFNLLLK